MPNATLDQVLQDALSLPPEEQQRLREALEQEARAAELRRIQNKYQRLPTSSEDFAARKAEEIELEERHD